MKKIIFLDIDGVLNVYAPNGVPDPIDPEKVELLKKIVKETGAEIVLSSTHRINPPEWPGFEPLKKAGIKWIDRTPVLERKPRGEEVAHWLMINPVENYAILDDCLDFLPGQHLFQCDLFTGLTPQIAEKVIAYLQKPPKYASFRA